MQCMHKETTNKEKIESGGALNPILFYFFKSSVMALVFSDTYLLILGQN